MELSPEVVRQVVLPTAAFHTPSVPNFLRQQPKPADPCWETSSLNPKNRIDSLDFPKHPAWRIDGCIAYGTQFYAVPLFLAPAPPRRVDVFITGDLTAVSPQLRRVLDLGTAFHTRDTNETQQLGITRHIIRCLQHWTTTSGEVHMYTHFPFGSRIVLNNIPTNVKDACFRIAPSQHLERQMLSIAQLQTIWKYEGIELPPTIDISELEYKKQPHDSISIVTHGGNMLVFKALLSHTKFLYHELRQLLLLPAHPNIIQRPLHLVTKKCGFGTKTAVVGFTLRYHPLGTVRDHLPYMALHHSVKHKTEVRWALQLVDALQHLHKSCGTFYSDLRLDNILLSNSHDLVLVDFEQRGVWCEFASPEINAIECLRVLAMDDEIPELHRDKYSRLLTQLLPNWESAVHGEEYEWPAAKQGYNMAWQCLNREEQESCEVYMLGRVLWCIFEAQSAPQRAAIWTSYKSEPTVEFPSYARTPPELQKLINWCTAGHEPTLSSLLVRSGDKLVLRELEATGQTTQRAVLAAARSFWTARVAESERWVRKRITLERIARGIQRSRQENLESRKSDAATGSSQGCIEVGRRRQRHAFHSRPSLSMVQNLLQRYQSSL
ncbi:hypothetical protein NQ176_g3465 [Zarea fungicola]|uniref:Uncharacterized protein n=1 Tax=Zarea fungicola TaxID=93591 RepID=A0ACC1NJ51_9HYPO|nr:hypothetical protein NQ176_g3465 [Lecanicillium fungicola]